MKKYRIFYVCILLFLFSYNNIIYGQGFLVSSVPSNSATNANGPISITTSLSVGSGITTGTSTTGGTVNGLYVGARSGYTNVALGVDALFSATSPTDNIAIGWNALYSATGLHPTNIAIGNLAMQNSTGHNNVCVGGGSGRNTTGYSNTGFGHGTLQQTSGAQNVAVGEAAMQSTTSGGNNTAVGYGSLTHSGTYTGNSGFGNGSLSHLAAGSNNVALGNAAMLNFVNGTNNVAIGYNTIIPGGDGSISPNVTVDNRLTIQNVIYGIEMNSWNNASLTIGLPSPGPSPIPSGLASGGYAKLHLGGNSGASMPSLRLTYVPNYTGTAPVTNQSGLTGRYLFVDQWGVVCQAPAVGLQGPQGIQGPAGPANTNAWEIHGNNFTSGAPHHLGTQNNEALNFMVANIDAGTINPSTHNNFYGQRIANSTVSIPVADAGSDNVAMGYAALYTNSSSTGQGNYNTAIGNSALKSNGTGFRNTAIGYNADVASSGLENTTVIGFGAQGSISNTMQLGNTDVTDVYIANTDPANPFLPTTGRLVTAKIQVTTNPTAGYVLTSDVNGNGTWQPIGCPCRQEFEEEIQEMNHQNTDYKKEIDELKKQLEELKSMITANANTEGTIKISQASDAILFQNAPNPFTKSTVIKYSIPASAKKAVLTVTSVSGVKIKEFDLKNKNAQAVEISAGELSAGTYIYSLIVDDSFVDAKQMVLTR